MKHDICLHSGIANRRGIVDIGMAPLAQADFVSYSAPLGMR